jgi:hypothetical protein
VSQAAAPAGAFTASAPGRLELSGAADGPRLSIALDRRALCRVEGHSSGLLVESKDTLTRLAAADVDELVTRSPHSLAAHVLAVAGAEGGLRVVTEWKLPAGSGVDGDGALALAAATAVTRALGRDLPEGELVALAGEASRRAAGTTSHGIPAALRGGVLRTLGAGPSVEAERLGVDPGRIEECLVVVDAGSPGGEAPAPSPGDPASARAGVRAPQAGLTDSIVEALRSGRYEDVVELLAREAEGAPATAGQRAVVEVVRGAGGAARPLAGRLVAVWAPPGARGPGRKEAVSAALKASGCKVLPVRVDLRGLELE